MKQTLIYLYLILIGFSTASFGQDFEYEDNRYSHEIKSRNFSECHSYIIKLLNDTIQSKILSSIEKYNNEGLIVEIIDFNKRDTSNIMFFHYNEKGFIDSIYWYWYETDYRPFQELEKITYKRDTNGLLLEECEYHLNESKSFELDSCMRYSYVNRQIKSITNFNGDTINYFIHKGGITITYNSNDQKKSEYSRSSFTNYLSHYKREYRYNEYGNEVEQKLINLKSGETRIFRTEYDGGLRKRYTVYNDANTIYHIIDYIWK